MSYRAPLKDMLFDIKELAGIDAVAALPGFEDAGYDTAAAVLEEAAKFSEGVLAPLNVDGDKKEAVETLVETGEGERDKIVREAEEKAARVGRDASFLVEQEAKQLRLDITKETVELAVAKAEALLKATVTQADHDRLAEEFLAELATKSEKPAVKAGGAA